MKGENTLKIGGTHNERMAESSCRVRRGWIKQ